MSVFDNPHVYDAIQIMAARHVTSRRLESVLSAAAGQEVLDIGAGTGSLAKVLPPGATYRALDNDPAKLERLQQKVPDAQCLLRSALDTGLEDAAVDWTVSVTVAHHLDDDQLAQAMAEMARVTSRKMVFIDALWTGKWGIQRLIWRYDRGFYPRRTEALLDALREHFDLERVEHYKMIQNYLLCIGRPRRDATLTAAT
jgi:SAM-dependent methyltransferase